MLDIIIPTYKNKDGLRNTLRSINQSLLEDINITVIDDNSEMYNNDILEEFPFFTIYYQPINKGPGAARELGLLLTNEPYVMFIDTGDYFVNNEIQEEILKTISNNNETVVFSWPYLHGNKVSKETSNRLHGRVYKREFLNNYNIEFCQDSSFVNEDIGFNRLCRLIIQDKNLKVLNFKEAAIVYDIDEQSLTNKDDKAFFYKEQNMGLALNSIHTVKFAKQNNVSQELIDGEISAIMASLYYTFLCTCYERPKFIQDAWDGAKLFYDTCFDNSNLRAESPVYGPYMKRIYNRSHKWKNFKNPNFSRFLKDLKTYSQPPSWYKE